MRHPKEETLLCLRQHAKGKANALIIVMETKRPRGRIPRIPFFASTFNQDKAAFCNRVQEKQALLYVLAPILRSLHGWQKSSSAW